MCYKRIVKRIVEDIQPRCHYLKIINWDITMIEEYIRRIKFLKWHKSNTDNSKLNVNAYKFTKKDFRVGGVIRNSLGNYVIGFNGKIEASSSIEVEGKALVTGILIYEAVNFNIKEVEIKLYLK
jgi:hypothetical protein